jgi:hypothetical protein
MLDPWTCMLDLSDILDMYVGHVCTRFMTLCVLWTCIEGFDVWIHVEIETNAELGSYAILLIYMWYSGSYVDVWI